MYNSDTELLFPSRVIPGLRTLRNDKWAELIDLVSDKNPNAVEYMAFVLMMVRLGGCLSCNADSFRAMRGCTQCARQTVRRYRGTDQELVHLYNETLREADTYLEKAGLKVKKE